MRLPMPSGGTFQTGFAAGAVAARASGAAASPSIPAVASRRVIDMSNTPLLLYIPYSVMARKSGPSRRQHFNVEKLLRLYSGKREEWHVVRRRHRRFGATDVGASRGPYSRFYEEIRHQTPHV